MNKASGSDGILAELIKIIKVYAFKVLHSVCQKIWKTQQWPQDWTKSVFNLIPKKLCQRMFTSPYNCTHFTCQQGNTQNTSSQASTLGEPKTFRYTSWIQKRHVPYKKKTKHSCLASSDKRRHSKKLLSMNQKAARPQHLNISFQSPEL